MRIIANYAHGSRTMLAIGKPSVLALELLEHLRQSPSLYDAMDDFPAFYGGISRLALARREMMISHCVDVIWASSTKLKARWDHSHKDVRLVHNGLDLSALPTGGHLPWASQKRVLGYVGTMASWFDWEWVIAVAEARPNELIRLIGPVYEQPPKKLPRNIEILPACEHSAALRAMSEFDVGLIPFKNNDLTVSVDPIKYYEYRGLGLPVITTDFGEMSLRSDVQGVFISRNSIDAAALVESALRYPLDSEHGLAFARQNAWEVRFDAAGLFGLR